MNNPVIDDYGNKHWYNEKGEFHREDGPAIEYANGNKYWYLNGMLHREDGPACEHENGSKFWRLNGKLHREDGPAIECASGYKAWFLNHVEYSEEAFNEKMKSTQNTKEQNMSKTIQFVIEMPVPAHLTGFPYDEIEYHFMKNYMDSAQAYIFKKIKTTINNKGVVIFEDTNWLASAQDAKLTIAK